VVDLGLWVAGGTTPDLVATSATALAGKKVPEKISRGFWRTDSRRKRYALSMLKNARVDSAPQRMEFLFQWTDTASELGFEV